MKKIFVLLGAVLSVAACANNYDYECAGYVEEEQCPCEEQPVYECQQQPQYYQPAPTYTPQPCGSCSYGNTTLPLCAASPSPDPSTISATVRLRPSQRRDSYPPCTRFEADSRAPILRRHRSYATSQNPTLR